MNPYFPPNEVDDRLESDHSLGLKLAELVADLQTKAEALAELLAEVAEDAGLEDNSPEIVEQEPPVPPDDPVEQPQVARMQWLGLALFGKCLRRRGPA